MSEQDANYERAEHDHGRGPHLHAWADYPHAHLLRAVCLRPECEGCPTHNIHARPVEDAESVAGYCPHGEPYDDKDPCPDDPPRYAELDALTDRQNLARHLTREHNASAIARMKFEVMKGWHRGVHTHEETAAFHRRHTHEAAVIDGSQEGGA